jgi:cytosine/uracil/thiamine/allantoin permease
MCSWLHCLLLEHVENTEKTWEKNKQSSLKKLVSFSSVKISPTSIIFCKFHRIAAHAAHIIMEVYICCLIFAIHFVLNIGGASACLDLSFRNIEQTFGLGIIILQGVSRRNSLAGVNKFVFL